VLFPALNECVKKRRAFFLPPHHSPRHSPHHSLNEQLNSTLLHLLSLNRDRDRDSTPLPDYLDKNRDYVDLTPPASHLTATSPANSLPSSRLSPTHYQEIRASPAPQRLSKCSSGLGSLHERPGSLAVGFACCLVGRWCLLRGASAGKRRANKSRATGGGVRALVARWLARTKVTSRIGLTARLLADSLADSLAGFMNDWLACRHWQGQWHRHDMTRSVDKRNNSCY
jgi:hypothetical protein